MMMHVDAGIHNVARMVGAVKYHLQSLDNIVPPSIAGSERDCTPRMVPTKLFYSDIISMPSSVVMSGSYGTGVEMEAVKPSKEYPYDSTELTSLASWRCPNTLL